MKSAEELLREVMHDPAYDVTPEGDPLAAVWGKARAIRRRRALTASGTVVVVAAAAAIAADDEEVWVPVVGTRTMHRFAANTLLPRSDVTDPRGALLGPNVATRYGAWAADSQGLSLFMADGTSPRGDARPGIVCT